MSIPIQPRPVPPAIRAPVPPQVSSVFEPATKEPEPVQEEESIVVLEAEKDPEKVLEERRKKRMEIMAKYKAGAPKTPDVAAGGVLENVGTGTDSLTPGGIRTGGISETGATPLLKQLGTRSVSLLPATSAPTPNPAPPSLIQTPLGHDFDLTKQAEGTGSAVLPSSTKADSNGADLAVSAADYDPTQEAKLDREKRLADGAGEPIEVKDEIPGEDEWEEVEVSEEEDEELDMFAAFGADSPPKPKKKVTVRRLKSQNGAKPPPVKKQSKVVVPDSVDNVDDSDGYYRITPGETLDDGRYQVTTNLGKGMFSAVVKAKVLKAVDQERRQDVVGREVAIKVIRSQESMYVAGRKEAQILQKLKEADPEDKKHIVRMERIFEHRGHLCIVTESLSMNLRDVIKRFGKDVGLNMRAVRAYAHQMFLALSLMKKCDIVHADMKPDNVLVTENKATLKVCDLGSASDVSDGEITPYLVSRFYRAPEIILGLPFDTAIDIWSVGCTLFELYTGKILFPGRSNNHMLLLMMELKGKFNHRMIKKATFGEMHFDEGMNFISVEKDKITGMDAVKTLVISKPAKDLKARLLPSSAVQVKMKDEELKMLVSFVDLLDKCLALDPLRRLTPRDALMHPFVTGH
ncbi:serine/threonine-protein kinase PRP4, partial [Tremellales sp. Uapishka_1]